MYKTTSIGLDVHARSIHAAILNTTTGELSQQKLTDTDDEAVLAYLRDFVTDLEAAHVVYEAGPTGYHLARCLNAAGIACEVLAPSKLVRPAGDRVKTDKRDAVFLARIAAVGEYVAVRIPDPVEESARDLVRARDDARRALMTARHHLSKLLLRYGLLYPGRTTWGREHDAWLRRQRSQDLGGAGGGTLTAFDDAYDDVATTRARRDRLDAAITADARSGRFAPAVDRLCCLRGISTLTGYGLAVEIGDWDRFTPTSIGSYLGLTPSEHSSGQSRSQGGITRTGNSHARRLLVESAWLHAKNYRPGKTLRDRWARAPRAVAVHADKGNRRLHSRWVTLTARKKHGSTVTAAVARELSGWCQVVATMDA